MISQLKFENASRLNDLSEIRDSIRHLYPYSLLITLVLHDGVHGPVVDAHPPASPEQGEVPPPGVVMLPTLLPSPHHQPAWDYK